MKDSKEIKTLEFDSGFKTYIKREDGYYRVYIETEIVTIHKFHSEKLNKDNAERLLQSINKQSGEYKKEKKVLKWETKMDNNIVNALEEQNRLKKIELQLKVIEMSVCRSADIDPSLSKYDAEHWTGRILDE